MQLTHGTVKQKTILPSYTGESGVTNIELIIREPTTVELNTDVEGYNSLSLTSEDGFTRQLDRTTTSYLLYVGEWEINVDLVSGTNEADLIEEIFGAGNYRYDDTEDKYYYIVA